MMHLLPPGEKLDHVDVPPRDTSHNSHQLEGNAFRGLKRAIRGSSRFSALIFLAALIVVSAAVLGSSGVEWCLLVIAIGLLLTTELLLVAVQETLRGMTTPDQTPCASAKDMASAAGLVSTIAAIVIAAAVFAPRLVALFGSEK
jgi:diacylglycerol kinase (ATP)